jgi:tRNA-modifying protein YgfZ
LIKGKMMFQQTLSQRGFISITGQEAKSYLQGIITNDIFKVRDGHAVYSCFLTPQGKYLADFFMYPHEDGVLLDVDQSLLPDLLKRLTMYRLRSKAILADVSDQFSVTAVWGAEQAPQNAYPDPRNEIMGFRVLNTDVDAEQGDYILWQMQNGIPDVADFARERTSMLEANMDMLNALSWDKGCYMGQELTARTHYRGLIKKRFLPLELSQSVELERDAVIKSGEKTIGHIMRSYKDYALGQMTLEHVQNGQECTIGDVTATLHIPSWFTE